MELRPDAEDEVDDEKGGAKEDLWSDLGIENFVEQMLQVSQQPSVAAAQSHTSNLGTRPN